MKYGNLPAIVGATNTIHPTEVLYYLYLPISMVGDPLFYIPDRLKVFEPLIQMVQADEPERFIDDYVYITAKRMYVSPEITPNRMGWHADGFMSNDLNYVWYDSVPTIFNKSEFKISPDHVKSLVEFDTQALPANDVIYPPYFLLKLDQSVVHRVQEAKTLVMRTFVKISISEQRYNLKDNSHNHLLDYNWPLHDRQQMRNDPRAAGKDYVK